MSDPRETITQLADMMDEFRLNEAELEMNGVVVRFSRKPKATAVVTNQDVVASAEIDEMEELAEDAPAEPVRVAGTPVNSPINGIFYAAPSPGSPPFVKLGDSVNAGDVIGLIEAMKSFNEITSPVSGSVLSVSVESGAVVMPGQAIMHIG